MFFEGHSLRLVLKVRLHESSSSCLGHWGFGFMAVGLTKDELEEAARLQLK